MYRFIHRVSRLVHDARAKRHHFRTRRCTGLSRLVSGNYTVHQLVRAFFQNRRRPHRQPAADRSYLARRVYRQKSARSACARRAAFISFLKPSMRHRIALLESVDIAPAPPTIPLAKRLAGDGCCLDQAAQRDRLPGSPDRRRVWPIIRSPGDIYMRTVGAGNDHVSRRFDGS